MSQALVTDEAKSHFIETLSRHIEAKMEAEGKSYRDIANDIHQGGINYVFRARHGVENPRYKLGIPEPLIALLDYLQLEPTDFAKREKTRPGDIENAILAYDGLPVESRRVMVDIFRAFVKAVGRSR